MSLTSLLQEVSAAPPAIPAAMLRTLLAGRYSIERVLGEGGMGAVFLAREVELDRPVALKVIRADLAADPVFRSRLVAEARIAAGLSHPNVVPVHRLDDVSGVLLLVMGFVDGSSLRERLRQGRLPIREALSILRDVAWALAHAHAAGVVHGDIKPDNILVERSSGRVVVADFGIATRGSEGSRDVVGGTPVYMSPEQASGGVVDARTDLYALGVTAWELLSGETPTASPARPLDDVPPAVAALVAQLLDPDASKRVASARQLADRLTALIEGASVPPELRSWAEGDRGIDPGFALIAVALSVPAFGHQELFWVPALALLYAAARRLVSLRALFRSGHRTADLRRALAARLDEATPSVLPTQVARRARLLRTAQRAGAGILGGGVLVAMALAPFVVETEWGFPVLLGVSYAMMAAFAVLTVASVARGLLAPERSMAWMDRIAARTRRWFWGHGTAELLEGLLAGSQRQVPANAHVERRLLAATTGLLKRRPAGSEGPIGDLAGQLERVASAARTSAENPLARARLVEAVTHLERLKVALEVSEPGAGAVDLAEEIEAARAFLVATVPGAGAARPSTSNEPDGNVDAASARR